MNMVGAACIIRSILKTASENIFKHTSIYIGFVHKKIRYLESLKFVRIVWSNVKSISQITLSTCFTNSF